MQIQPDEGISLQFGAKQPGPEIRLGGVRMDFKYRDYFHTEPSTGYETLVYDAMIGDAMLFQRADSVEAGWCAVQPILDVWHNDPEAVPLEFYPAGTAGPEGAEKLMWRSGREWRPIAPRDRRAVDPVGGFRAARRGGARRRGRRRRLDPCRCHGRALRAEPDDRPGCRRGGAPGHEKPLDVHLMIVEPERYIEDFARAGADHLLVHCEASATIHLHRTLSRIRELGKTAGVVLNPATPLTAIEHVLDLCDMVLIMTVNPGFGGQKFLPSMLPKIRALKRMCDERGLATIIEVDGGIGGGNAWQVIEAGAASDRRRLGRIQCARLRRGDRRDPPCRASLCC